MKLSYNYYRRFRGLFSVGIILAVITLLSSCSSELPDLSLDQIEDNENTVESQDPFLLRFQTIEELENISVADIPGDHVGFELKELSYECVDTIELRALLFDVKAKLRSSSNHEKVISFSAEVGPELVSVEYYPGGEMVPAHDNMIHSYYPKVERYRNYSDGSRIGPDEFYDYGHPIHFFINHAQYLETGFGKPTYDFDRISLGVTDYNFCEDLFEMDYNYENGVYSIIKEGWIKYNKNTIVIDENNSYFSGEDLYPIIAGTNNGLLATNSRDRLSLIIGNYYSSEGFPCYQPGRLTNIDDPEVVCFFNLGRDVPDVSPIPFMKDEKNMESGWYYTQIIDLGRDFGLMSKLTFSKELCPLIIRSYNEFYLQYLVIDGRIIDFDGLLDDYERIYDINPEFCITKIENGYNLTSEIKARIYGEKFKCKYSLNIEGVDGPEDVIEYLNDYGNLEKKDSIELDNQTRSNSGNTFSSELIPRKDGRTILIDQRLPWSIRNTNN